MKPILRALMAFFAMILLPTAFCQADGFIIIQNPPQRVVPGHFAFAPLEVTYHHVTVDINDQVAVTTVDQEFYNPNSAALEGTYLFPLPSGAHIDKFSMDIDGKMMDAELLPADKARQFYEDIVRKFRDPALLEYMGRDAFKVRIFPINGNSRKQIKLTYTQLLKSDTGLVEYVYPMNTEKFSSRPLDNVSMKINLSCKDPIKTLYCPTNNVEIRRDGEKRATIGWEARNFRPDVDFKLVFSRSKDAVGVDLLTYRQGNDDGYFVLLASPGLTAHKGSVQKKDVCFVLDTSGSMSGAKIEQAKKAMSFCLNSLDETDHFEVIRFSTECEPLFSELRPATKENVNKALDFVKGMKAIGGTAIEDALKQALSYNRLDDLARKVVREDTRDREYEIVFLTDGEPTIGETNEDNLVSLAAKTNPGTRIFCFGIGNDVNTHLLDRIAADTRAFSTYVAPEEDIEVKVSNFYTKIKEPVLSNVQLAFTGENIRTSELYPNVLPDLFKGEMLIAFGRYSGKGAAAVKITGTLNGEKQTFASDVNFTDHDTTNAFIPRLWATRRVGYLLDQIRLHGESKELKDEVTRLAREHGIVTPYTAYLILEDEQHRNVPLSRQSFREFGEDKQALAQSRDRFDKAANEAAAPSARTGKDAVDSARALSDLKNSDNFDQSAQSEPQGPLAKAPLASAGGNRGGSANLGPSADKQSYGYRDNRNYAQQARVLNGRAFYQNGNTWTDSTAQNQKDLPEKKIAFGSEEYFALLQKHPEALEWLSLGNEVDVVLDGTLYEIR